MQNNYRLDITQTRVRSHQFHQTAQNLIRCPQKDIKHQGLEVILASNPRNPTGQVIQGDELKDLVALYREGPTSLILDEVRAISCL